MTNPWATDFQRASRPRRVQFAGLSFEPPAQWLEESIVTATRPGPAPRPTLSLMRVDLPPGQTLETAVTSRVGELRKFEFLRVIRRRETTLGGRAAIAVDVSFSNEKETMLMQMLFVQTSVSLFVVTGCAVIAQAREMQMAFRHACTTLRLDLAGGSE